jgi:hypothetical protein
MPEMQASRKLTSGSRESMLNATLLIVSPNRQHALSDGHRTSQMNDICAIRSFAIEILLVLATKENLKIHGTCYLIPLVLWYVAISIDDMGQDLSLVLLP